MLTASRPNFWRMFALGCALFLPSWGQARELVDATGVRVKLSDMPMRVVTLAPSLGELAADLSDNQLERIVGVSEYTDYPPALEKKPQVGSYAHFNLEKVVSLKPDLVLATLDGNPKDQVLHLRELGVPVVVVATSTFAEVESSIRLVGQAMGASVLGEKMAKTLHDGVAKVRETAVQRAGAKPRVLLQIGDQPMVMVGRKAFLHEALEVVGAKNVYGDSDAHYPRPSIEETMRRDPDVILVLALGKDLAPFNEMARSWMKFGSMRAVKAKQVRVVQGDTILRPTLRLLEGLMLLQKAIYGKK